MQFDIESAVAGERLNSQIGVGTDLLDCREAALVAEHPIAGACNIPLAELISRSHELPAKGRTLRVADSGPAADACAQLTGLGRTAIVEPHFEFELRTSKGKPRLWAPNPFLVECVAALAPGRALDLGCGVGRDSVALAALGWHTLGLDRLPDALDRACDLRRRYLYPDRAGALLFERVDLDSGLPPSLEPFDLVAMLNYLNRAILSGVREQLAPGGAIVVQAFTTEHRARYGKPRSDALVVAPGELRRLLGDLEIQRYQESWVSQAHTARAWATIKL